MRSPRREKAIERKVCARALEELGVPNIKLLHLGGETGWPDRMFFIPGGQPFLVEFKEVGYKPTRKQEYIHDMLEGLGYDVAWTDNEEATIQAIQARLDKGGPRLSKARR